MLLILVTMKQIVGKKPKSKIQQANYIMIMENNKKGSMVRTNPSYWDCECQKNYILPITQKSCPLCNATEEGSPESREEEVLALHGDIQFVQEGDQIMCVGKDYIDLQHSPAGFGETQGEAYEDYLDKIQIQQKS